MYNDAGGLLQAYGACRCGDTGVVCGAPSIMELLPSLPAARGRERLDLGTRALGTASTAADQHVKLG